MAEGERGRARIFSVRSVRIQEKRDSFFFDGGEEEEEAL
jgi:hypothetical protein